MEIVQLTNEQFENFSKNYNIKNFNQTVEYGTLMDRHNFDDYYLGLIDDNNNILAATLILVNKVFIGYKWGYCPRGYLIDYNDYSDDRVNYLNSLVGKCYYGFDCSGMIKSFWMSTMGTSEVKYIRLYDRN